MLREPGGLASWDSVDARVTRRHLFTRTCDCVGTAHRRRTVLGLSGATAGLREALLFRQDFGNVHQVNAVQNILAIDVLMAFGVGIVERETAFGEC
jgi:hypothetical protein